MPARFVDFVKAVPIWFGPAGATVVITNNDAANDIRVAKTEEIFNNFAPGAALNVGTKVVHGGGGINWPNAPDKLWARVDGAAAPVFVEVEP